MAHFVKDLKNFKELFNGKSIGTTFSCWDLLHSGHNLFLEDCKKIVIF